MTYSSSSAKRRYRPGLEGLEARRLPSAGLIGGAEALLRPPAPLSASAAEVAHCTPCGTGKSIIIITTTQCEVGPQIGHAGE
jgi:hypothetical protein